MKLKKILTLAVICIMMITANAYAAEPEDALSARPDDAFYAVMRLEDTSRLLSWIFSEENLGLVIPLMFDDKPEIELLGMTELIRLIFSASPVRSAALAAGVCKSDVKTPFMQAALKFSPEVSDIIRKISEGSAEAIDVARIFLGKKLQAEFAETMIKVEPEKDNIFRVNNELFMKAADDMLILGTSINEVRWAVKALNDPKSRLLTRTGRKFTEKDFSVLHIDYETIAEIDEDNELDDLDARKYFDKPLEIECAYRRLADKFQISTAVNISTSMKKEYADKIIRQKQELKPIRGGNIDIEHAGGSASPLFAMGTHLDFSAVSDNEIMQPFLKKVLRNLRVRFGISDGDAIDFFTGPFSAIVNDTVTFEGFKIPAIYLSQTGRNGAGSKIYAGLTKSPHFSKVQDGILQLDSSISPISCLIVDNGDTLGVDFAELSSLSDKPAMKPLLSELMEREAIASMWIDFAGIQSWINDDKNGVFATLGPIASFMGFGKYVKMARELLSAEFSVPSMSLWGENPEIIHTEFALKDIDVKNGLFARIIKVYKELKSDEAARKGAKD